LSFSALRLDTRAVEATVNGAPVAVDTVEVITPEEDKPGTVIAPVVLLKVIPVPVDADDAFNSLVVDPSTILILLEPTIVVKLEEVVPFLTTKVCAEAL
jgi:hypothetical protein